MIICLFTFILVEDNFGEGGFYSIHDLPKKLKVYCSLFIPILLLNKSRIYGIGVYLSVFYCSCFMKEQTKNLLE